MRRAVSGGQCFVLRTGGARGSIQAGAPTPLSACLARTLSLRQVTRRSGDLLLLCGKTARFDHTALFLHYTRATSPIQISLGEFCNTHHALFLYLLLLKFLLFFSLSAFLIKKMPL